MPNWGPFSCSSGAGTVWAELRSCQLWDNEGTANGPIRNIEGTVTQTYTGGRPDAAWAVNVYSYDIGGHQLANDQVVTARASQATASFTLTPNPLTTSFKVTASLSAYVGQSMTWTASGTWDRNVLCAYGTQPKDALEPVRYIDYDFIVAVLAFAEVPWLPVAVFAGIIGLTISSAIICKKPPPELKAFSTAAFNWSPQDTLDYFIGLAWGLECECVPGAPAPVPYPPPHLVQPPDLPAPPVFSCDGTNVCATLVDIQRQLASLTRSMSQTLAVATLVQRYETPFATIPGARHPNLVGEGSFAVPRIVGLELEVQARDAKKTKLGNPDYVYDIGWVAIADARGMIEEIRFTRDHEVWLPKHASEATAFLWAVNPDVTFAVTELYAEP